LTVTGSAPPFLGQGKVTYVAPNQITAKQTIVITATASDGTQAFGQIVLNPPTVTVVVTPSSPTVLAGTTQQFSAQVFGISQTTVTWSISPSGTGSIDPNGLYTAPATVTSGTKVTVTAASTFDPTASGSATITLQSNIVTVTVSPSSASLLPNSTQQFTATVANTANTAVTWSISPQTGAIDQTGLYTAPGSVSSSTKVTVTATSQADPTKNGTATITLSPTPAVGVTISPTTATLTPGGSQQFTATVTNATVTTVSWSISPQVGSIDATGLYVAPITATATQRVTVTATSQADPSKTATATVTINPVVDVGTGAPNSAVQSQFIQAFNRNGFQGMVSLPPLTRVTALGSSGYVQTFQDAAKDAGVTYALASLSPTVSSVQSDGTVVSVVQIWGPIYSNFTSLGGVGTVGYPLADTQGCPYFDVSNTCEYQLFDKGYALFTYSQPLISGSTNFSVSGTFYTQWTKSGGLSGVGRPITAQTAVTASTATTATAQTFSAGAIYSITSGLNKGQIFAVAEPMWDLFVQQNGIAGKLGLPTSNAIAQASGSGLQQYFEGGTLIWNGTGGSVQLPISGVAVNGAPTVSPGGSVSMNLGDKLTLTAVPYDTAGNPDLTRAVSWSTSNSKVISIQAAGQSAVLTAAGAGSATVLASSGGVSSTRLSFIVVAPCCQVGDGTPAAVQQSFQNALARNQLTASLPVAGPAVRTGNGYTQTVAVTSASGPVIVLIAEGDQSGSAYIVSGAVLARYQALNGPLGPLGYPSSDQSPGGTQLFSNSNALAGAPVRVVSGPVLSKWAATGYETGPAGAPASDVASFSTFAASSGMMQTFANGAIYAATAGIRSGQAYLVGGLILSGYLADGGPAGELGMPTSDEFVSAGVHQQNFEGGTVTYAPGAGAATVNPAPRTPAVIVSPATITAGGTAQIAVIGFSNNSTVRVSLTGQPDFLVTTANGAYSWSMYVPLTAVTQTVSIHAADTRTASTTADGALSIRGFSNTRAQLNKVQGDNQSGAPGALLPTPLTVTVTDASGNPVSGAVVTFEPSAGQVAPSSAVTDASGRAAASLRLPLAGGAVGVTARCALASAAVTFYANTAANTLSNFPKVQQSGGAALGNGSATIAQKGALLTAVASILQYRQNRGEVSSPNGTATPAALNQFLINDCSATAKGVQLCDGFFANPSSGEQVVNLWRAADFTGGVDVVPVAPTVSSLPDFLAQGEPLLLSLSLSLNGSPAGGHFVTAIGVNSDGSIAIQDPSPLFARTNLNDYLNGFATGQGKWQASLAGVVRFAVRTPSATRFLLGAISQPAALMHNFTLSAASAAGSCGPTADFVDSVDSSGNTPQNGPQVSRFEICDGLQPAYQIDVGASQSFSAFVTDLASGGPSFDLSGSAPASYSATRPQLSLTIAPQTAAFTAAGVVNAATFTSGIAPGGLISIFGTGLASAGGSGATVDFDGAPSTVIFATPFQVNAEAPPSITPGAHVLRVRSPFGSATQTVSVSAVAPAIFLLGDGVTAAVENQDYSINSLSNPLSRGQTLIIYCTGLGAVAADQSGLSRTTAPVTAIVNGVELPAAYAGLTPGFTGLYQVNVPIPAATPPGSGVSLTLKQGGQLSNTVNISLQ
jgi:uncharacterized protein (TIGR03437 family)